jgi:hypothetical protein
VRLLCLLCVGCVVALLALLALLWLLACLFACWLHFCLLVGCIDDAHASIGPLCGLGAGAGAGAAIASVSVLPRGLLLYCCLCRCFCAAISASATAVRHIISYFCSAAAFHLRLAASSALHSRSASPRTMAACAFPRSSLPPTVFRLSLTSSYRTRMEGIIVKNLSSKYLLNDRNPGHVTNRMHSSPFVHPSIDCVSVCGQWAKLKPDYIDGMADNLDLIILGGYYGKGTRRAGGISHFLLGLAEKAEGGGAPEYFYTFCKVGSGYSLEDLKELQSRLGQHWQEYDPRRQPKHFMG